MKAGYVVLGMLAGGVIGATAMVVAMPYIKPQINKAVHKSREFLDEKLENMEIK